LNGKQNKKTEDIRVRADRRGHFLSTSHVGGYGLLIQIVAPRWRAVTGEIDLIAKRRRLLVFVEVKCRFDSQHIAAPTVLKMRGNKRYITLTDESQNATLTLRMSDRS